MTFCFHFKFWLCVLAVAGLTGCSTVEKNSGGSSIQSQNYKRALAQTLFDAWTLPHDLIIEAATVSASVTVARDGRIVAVSLKESSGDSIIDRSVLATLNRLGSVAPFPAEMHEPSRTFDLRFNLKAKKKAG